MLSRRHRFHSQAAVRAVYKQGKLTRSPMMQLRLVERGANKPYRVAVVVSRKVHKSAVVRNRIRRRIYELVRLSPIAEAPGVDFVITVFSDRLATLEAAELQKLFDNLVRQAAKNETAPVSPVL